MRTFEDLLKDVEDESTVEKTASEGKETVEMLQDLKTSMEKSASQERVMKYASAAGSQFAKSAADKFAAAAESFVEIVNTDQFAEKVANIILEKLAVETSTKTIHSLDDPVEKKDPRDAVEKQQLNQDVSKPNKIEAKKQALIDKEVLESAVGSGEGTLLNKKAALDSLRELLGSDED